MAFASPPKCVSIDGAVAKSKQGVVIWDCNDDQKMSFKVPNVNPSPTPKPTPKPTPPAPANKCPKLCSSQGFQASDCRCDTTHADWPYGMWVCNWKGGQWSNKAWYCSQPDCNCNQAMESPVVV